jgi:hypothetical protein
MNWLPGIVRRREIYKELADEHASNPEKPELA